MAAAAVAPPVHPPRPHPAVIQSPHKSWAAHPLSSSTTSSSTAPATPPWSNPNSGESWFKVSSSDYLSSSSHSYVPPLPRGARPPSPQPFVLTRDPTRLLTQYQDLKNPTRPPNRRSSSSWKLEWRGLSKVVKWAFLGDHRDEVIQRERHRSVRLHDTAHGRKRNPQSARPLHDEHNQYGPPSPLSPSTSATCVDLTYDGTHMLSGSELGHSSEAGHKPAARYQGMYPPPPPHVVVQDFDPRGQRSNLVS